MEMVRSTWVDKEMRVGEAFATGRWEDAGAIALGEVATVFVKNDAEFLYLGIDVAGDSTDDTGDYFWVVVDANGDGEVTPYLDRLYSHYPKRPGVLARAYFTAPLFFTGVSEVGGGSELYTGFEPGPSPFLMNRRVWELRIPLTELGAALVADRGVPAVHLGFRIGSGDPPIDHWALDFSNLHRVRLATGPSLAAPLPAGAVVGSIGLIPRSAVNPSTGLATTVPGYAVAVSDASFGGALNIIGNRATNQYLWAQGARRVRVLHRAPRATAGVPLRQAWVNYRWVGRTDVPEAFGPDAADTYPLLDPSSDYSIDDLLVRWQSDVGNSSGLHHLDVEVLRDDLSVVATDGLDLHLATSGLRVDLESIAGPWGDVPACRTVAAGAPLDFTFVAEDTVAGLADYALTARWGTGQAHTVTNGRYPLAGPGTGGRFTHRWAPTVPCAYAFEAAASSRVTDGYRPSIRSARASRYLTITPAT